MMFSCNESDFLEEVPRDQLTPENLYSEPEGFENGLNGLYALVRQERDETGGRQPGMLWWSSTDNSYNPVFNSPDLPYLQWGEFNNSTVGLYSDVWAWLYSTINAANTIITRADNPEIDWESEDQKNAVLAQARLIRSWAYRHLINLWGDVPLVEIESTGSNIRTDWDRAPIEDVMAFMEADWLFAEQHLPALHTTPGRLNKTVAQHYLAELYLMMDEPAKAEQKAQAAIDNPNFRLITERYGVNANKPGVPFMDQFYNGNVFYNQGNTEALWTLLNERNVIGGSDFNHMRRTWLLWYWRNSGIDLSPERGRGIGWLGFTKFALDLYEEGDDRGSAHAIHRYLIKNNGDTLFTTTDPAKFLGVGPAGLEPNRPNNWPATRKWDDGIEEILNDAAGYKDQPYLRLAETYLLLAEAQYKQDKVDEAAETLNVLRRRANASEITAADVSIDFILDERSRELFSEENRRYTLLRLGKWIERTQAHNHQTGEYITERDRLYPIPQPVIDANLDLVFPQNPGY
jgi:hypothetical protein